MAPDGSLIFKGTGTGTHTGRSTTVANVVPDLETTPPTYLVSGVITAANGDQIYFSGAATFSSATTATGKVDFTGGTGRFADATGYATFNDEFTLDSNGKIIFDHQTSKGFISF